jgi:hypothetical protein
MLLCAKGNGTPFSSFQKKKKNSLNAWDPFLKIRSPELQVITTPTPQSPNVRRVGAGGQGITGAHNQVSTPMAPSPVISFVL